MSDTLIASREYPAPLIRNEPVQARSAARLTALLDAAAAVVHEIGYERLTTAMVAEGAGASIGTVYRYFPDRIAVLQSLAARNEERATERVLGAIEHGGHRDWLEALTASFEIVIDMFRTEPGFASLRLGDVIDLRPAEGDPRNVAIAQTVYGKLVERFGIAAEPEVAAGFEAAVEASDALVARAFARDPQGDPQLLATAERSVRSILASYLPLPPH